MMRSMQKSEPLSNEFLEHLKQATEARWATQSVDPTAYGFQFRPGTRWNPGLADRAIAEYESLLKLQFPRDLKAFLRAMNGTDLTTLNVYGNSGEPPRESVGVYAYPRDIETVRQRIKDIQESRSEIAAGLAEQGFDLPPEAGLAPIFSHRYVVCGSDPASSVVLSIVVHSTDAIVYANSLREYLEKELLGD